ncbi:MAG: glycoside hydrolase family 31 protein [Ignavibacteria bacterium]|jgi:alpha-glucosidase (family GH31 glycosyl hydrolase)
MKYGNKTYFLYLILFLVISNNVTSQPVWEKDEFKIYLEDNELEIYHDQLKLAEITSFEFNFVKPDEVLVQSATPDSLILKLTFTEADGHHQDFPASILLSISQFNDSFHFYTSHSTFNHITIRLKDQDEHYFGLIEKLYPHNSKSPDLRGNVVDVEIYARGEEDYAENYASAYSAFYMSNLGYAGFFDTFAKGRYHLGINGVTEIYHQTGTLDWYLFYGPTGDKIHKQYYDVIGKPKFVPLWACGPIFWRDQNEGGKDEILDDIQKFTDLKIPLTGCFVDRPYCDGGHEWSKMNFNSKFAEPEKWIKTINEKYGMEFMTWIGSLTFTDKDFPGLLPNYRSYIDLTNPEAVKEFENRLNKHQYSVGVKGHKMDRADENFPVTAKWNEPVTESESRNKYVYLFSKVINDFLTNAHGKDQFNFARAAFHRSQPYLSAVWGGDCRNNWIGMSGNVANAIRCGFMGFPVWGSDTGGYLGEGRIDETLYIRWLQLSVWNGMFQVKIDGAGGSGEDRPPWKYSEQLQKVYKNVSDLRMEMLPYIYSCANTSYKNGVMMKPLTYTYPGDENTYNIWDEFILGNTFLVAPVFSEDNNREIYLPEGKWYDLANQSVEYKGPVTFKQNVPLESIPVFIKENSVYITGNIFQGNSKLWEKELEGNEEITVHAFPGEAGSSTTFDYVDYFDADKEKQMKLEHQTGKIVFTSVPVKTKSTIKVKCPAKPERVLSNGNQVNFEFDDVYKSASVSLGKDETINLEFVFTE